MSNITPSCRQRFDMLRITAFSLRWYQGAQMALFLLMPGRFSNQNPTQGIRKNNEKIKYISKQ